ncbi:MAG: ATP-binding domain-containing protein [Desulfuromonadales bacterium]|nr:ATP-binding domain-containing protein [Desulfuromonadales bacterium]
MHDTLDPATAAYIAAEEQRLADTCQAADRYSRERKEQLRGHDQKIRALKAERLNSNSPREIDKLTFEIQRLSQYDPAKYLIPFEQTAVPYLAGIAIRDDDPAIGRKHILLGKQALLVGSRVVVTDWRRAQISKLYYEWDEGEVYEDDIGERERSGTIEKKIAYGIARRELLSLQSGTGCLAKRDGIWGEPEQQNASVVKKESSGDHRMVDIVSLISREQFALITRKSDGCLYLTGGAGCGKTTVALHRLSYLVFNQPERFRAKRCLVVMFNKSLRNYVKKTSVDLLTNQLPVETFHSWAVKALRSFGVTASFTATAEAGLTALKKSSAIYAALRDYVKSPGHGSLLEDLGGFYADAALWRRHLGNAPQLAALGRQGRRLLAGAGHEIGFDDAGVLILLGQLRNPGRELADALGWYDHLLVDEAQDLSLVELHALMLATTSRRSLTVCADERQKILDFVDSAGFSAFQLQLQSAGLASGELDISYRSTRQIMALAARVSGRAVGKVVNEGPEPRFHDFTSQVEALGQLRRAVGALLAREKNSLTAIICRFKHEAETVYAALSELPGVRLQTADLSFEPGILVTNAHQVKGLEFSGVILWNPTQKAYPASELGKNLLYVAITRASDRLAVYHIEPLSPLFSA